MTNDQRSARLISGDGSGSEQGMIRVIVLCALVASALAFAGCSCCS
jgi:hypothetical protein